MLLNSFAMADFNPTFAVAKRAETLPKQVFDKPNHIVFNPRAMDDATWNQDTPDVDCFTAES
jgi:hypothetical protein